MNLSSIGQLVKQRRHLLGLSQARLARLSGLSRATINQLETGAIVDLGAAERPPRDHALALASRTASVSYKEVLTPKVLAAALVEGKLPAHITPQVATLLDEAPLPLIVGAVEEVARHTRCPAKTQWKHLVQWAHDLQSPRAVWA